MNRKHWFLTFITIIALNSAGNAQWVRQYGGLPTTWGVDTAPWGLGMAMDACGSSVAVIAVAGVQAPFYITKDSGNHFVALSVPKIVGDGPLDVSLVDSLHIWFVNSTRIYATTNGGESWKQQFLDSMTTTFFDYIKMFDLDNGVAVGDSPSGKPLAVLQTSDGGAHWNNMNTTELIGGASGDIWRRIHFVSKDVGYIYISGGSDIPYKIYKTTNGGASWRPVFVQYGVMNLKFYNEQIGLVRGYGSSAQIYRTLDGGIAWDTIAIAYTMPGWGNDFEFLPGNPAFVWYTDTNNLLFSNDTGRTWNQQPMDINKIHGRDIVFTDATHGWLLCDDGRLYRTVNGDRIVSSVGNTEAILPSGFQLAQNFPNPFNPSTTIRFEIVQRSAVKLKIFNVLGQLLTTLVDEQRNAGAYAVEWNATGVASGVYFYQLQAGDASTSSARSFVQTKKMLLLK